MLPEPPRGASQQAQVDHWRAIVLSDPDRTEARVRLARLLGARGETQQALDQLAAACNTSPDDLPLVLEYAHALTGLRRFDIAERELKRVLRLYPDASGVHLGLGIISFRRGLYAQADQELKRATELDPESDAALLYRGEVLNQLGRVDEALDLLRRAAQLQPSNARTYYLMGILYDRKSQPQEAAAMFRRSREVGSA